MGHAVCVIIADAGSAWSLSRKATRLSQWRSGSRKMRIGDCTLQLQVMRTWDGCDGHRGRNHRPQNGSESCHRAGPGNPPACCKNSLLHRRRRLLRRRLAREAAP